jgi:hypothetical protein
MARLKGFEPLAYGLEVRCSIQLSYRRVLVSVLEKIKFLTLIVFFVHIKYNANVLITDFFRLSKQQSGSLF